MKKLLYIVLAIGCFSLFFSSCKKDEVQAVYSQPTSIPSFTASVNQLTLSAANDSTTVVTFKWQNPDYGIKLTPTYTLQFDVPSDTTGANAWGNAINVPIATGGLQKDFLGTNFNAMLATQMGLPTGVASTIVVRLKADVNQSTGAASVIPTTYAVVSLVATPYKALIVYPALLVKGGNSWKTPSTRTDGYLLTSVKYDGKYEGYLNLPNADGYGGDAFQLISTTDGKVYGWGGTSTTMAVGGGNLYLTPAPAYMKVNADVNAGTINFTATKFYISGDDNGYSTSATPMTFNATNNHWEAKNVTLTAGKAFVFTCNGGYDISYKVDADGKLIFAGSPTWLGNNIPITKSGVFTVTLDLSPGAGNYNYSIK